MTTTKAATLLVSLLIAGGTHAVPMLYSFSGNSGVIVDELGLVAAAGLSPTGFVSYQFVVDLEQFTGTPEDRRYYTTLVSKPYLLPEPPADQFSKTEQAQSYNSPGLLAGNIGTRFDGLLGGTAYGDSYGVGVGVSSFSDPSVLLENWVVGGFYGGGETYRAPDGSRSSLTSYLRLDSVEAYRVPEPETHALLLAGLGLMGFVANRRKALRRGTK